MLLGPGEEYEFDGQVRRYPDTRLVYWAGGNPFHHHQDINQLVQSWQKRPEVIIVQDPYWTPTAKMADIVLPATTTLDDSTCMICESGGQGCDACRPAVADDYEDLLG